MRPGPVAQRGVALLMLVAVLALGATWFLVDRLNDSSTALAVANRNRNAELLNRAKLALIGYVVAQAAKANENRPGALPCPEAPGNFNDASNEGTVAYPCTPPIVGRFPWKSLGLEKMVDAAGEPLWYAVAAGWAGASTVINSDCASTSAATSLGLACAGRLTVDGAAGDVIAILFAPGRAFSVAASTGCAEINQARPTSGTPNWANYLECENASNPADASFASTGPSGSFNDQIVTITAAELMPALEAAIAQRMEKEIAPVLASIYSPASWGFSGSNPVYPFAATWANPSTSAMQGAAATYAGLLPLTYSETSPGSGTACTASGSVPRCDPTFVSWSSASVSGTAATYSESCSFTSTQVTCNLYYRCTIFGCSSTTTYPVTINATASNVARALRSLITSPTLSGVTTTSASAVLNPNASATLAITGRVTLPGTGPTYANSLCGLSGFTFSTCKLTTVSVPILSVLRDHSLLDSSTSSSTGWYIRNRWHEHTYYAVSSSNSPTTLPTAPPSSPVTQNPCTTNCLTVTNSGSHRAILILAGSAVNGATRPSATRTDYLEFGNATAYLSNTYKYEKQAAAGWRVSGYLSDTGAANAYVVSAATPTQGQSLRFRAQNANTGASTLSTASTGVRSILNEDGSALTVGQIPAQGVAEVVFDGTNFVLFRRPFNDRIIVVGSN